MENGIKKVSDFIDKAIQYRMNEMESIHKYERELSR